MPSAISSTNGNAPLRDGLQLHVRRNAVDHRWVEPTGGVIRPISMLMVESPRTSRDRNPTTPRSGTPWIMRMIATGGKEATGHQQEHVDDPHQHPAVLFTLCDRATTLA